MNKTGIIYGINGPVVYLKGDSGFKISEMVYVGKDNLVGEVIGLKKGMTTVQVFEETTGLRPGETVTGTGDAISVLLGPGIIHNIFDGIQRPLEEIAKSSGKYISRGVSVDSLDTQKKWHSHITVKEGDVVGPGTIIAETQETSSILHKSMVPPDITEGTVIKAAPDGDYTILEPIVTIQLSNGSTRELALAQKWPIRIPRPTHLRYPASVPLVTGQRILDTLFPIAKGGTAAVPGGFGTGKTMLAIEKARRLAETDQVLFLCFNHHLLQYLQSSYGTAIPNITFANLPLLTCRHMQISDAGGDEGISRYLNEYDQHSWPYKHIIIDEGQDFAECHLELLYAIAEITDGCFYVFYDKNQLVQQRQTLEWVNRVECRLILSRNCRNTRSIAVTSYKPIGIEKIKMRLDIPGQKPTMYLSRNTEDAHQTIGSIIRNYTQQGIQKKQIVVLTVKTEDTSILSGISSVGGYPLVSNRNDNGILFTSSRKFKGLESDVVIVVDVDDSCFLDDEKRRVFYVGSSRAKHFLDIVSVMNDEDTNSMVVRLTGEKKKNAKLALGSFLKVKIVSGSTTS